MKTTLQIIATLIFMAILFIATLATASAQDKETDLKPKSMGIATLLALDPIPGDALFYANKPGQAMGSILLGIPGAFLLGSGIALTSRNSYGPSDDYSQLGSVLILVGVLFYAPSLIWDAAGGISGVREYNYAIQRKHSLLERVAPLVAVTDRGGNVGVRIFF